MVKVHDWRWASKDSYKVSNIFCHPNEAVACNVADRLGGTVYHVKEGYIVALPNGEMANTVTHVNYICSAMMQVVI